MAKECLELLFYFITDFAQVKNNHFMLAEALNRAVANLRN